MHSTTEKSGGAKEIQIFLEAVPAIGLNVERRHKWNFAISLATDFIRCFKCELPPLLCSKTVLCVPVYFMKALSGC